MFLALLSDLFVDQRRTYGGGGYHLYLYTDQRYKTSFI
jgi:hypothetical protein